MTKMLAKGIQVVGLILALTGFMVFLQYLHAMMYGTEMLEWYVNLGGMMSLLIGISLIALMYNWIQCQPPPLSPEEQELQETVIDATEQLKILLAYPPDMDWNVEQIEYFMLIVSEYAEKYNLPERYMLEKFTDDLSIIKTSMGQMRFFQLVDELVAQRKRDFELFDDDPE